jgi:hypothetical protein
MTVTIQLTTAGIDTGSFSIFTNLDLVTPLVTGVSRASLLSGYPIVVPNSATSVIVKSNSTNCTNQVTIPISGITTTTTTTTTTQTCTIVTYGFDAFDSQASCENFNSSPSDYYFDGVNLYIYEPADPCGPLSIPADVGYYSDGTGIWLWDGSGNFDYIGPCMLTRDVTIFAKRDGTISGLQGVTILKSEDDGATWDVVVSGAILGTGFTTAHVTTATEGNNLWLGALLTSTDQGISFGAALSPTNTTCLSLMAYCGNPSIASTVSPSCNSFTGPFSYNSGEVNGDKIIYLNFSTINDEGFFRYGSCV